MNESDSPRIIGAADLRKYMRLPRANERDPLFGLSRSFLNTLILPCKENGYSPPVASLVLRRRRTSRSGVRLVDTASLEAFIAQNPQLTIDRTRRERTA
jgi:hypothetical protein